MKEFRGETTHNHQKDGPHQEPVEVTTGSSQVPEIKALPDHEQDPDENRQTADVRQNLPGAQKAEGVDEVTADQGVHRTRYHHESDQGEGDETEKDEEMTDGPGVVGFTGGE